MPARPPSLRRRMTHADAVAIAERLLPRVRRADALTLATPPETMTRRKRRRIRKLLRSAL